MLKVKDLHKFYGGFHAVRGVSFTVDRGEIIGFLGPNGAGKTTTMKIITGYMAMSSGEVSVDDHDVMTDSLAVRSKIGYLPEHAPLYDDMSVLEYLRFVAEMRGLKGTRKKERIDYVIGVCSLEPKRRKPIRTLSKGYRQRVGLAQAIVHDPQLVILDEPTVGLDPNQIVEIRELLRDIGERNTVILSSHILSEVEATCGRVIIVNDGRIAANGRPADLEREHGGLGVYDLSLAGPADDSQVVAGLEALPSVESASSLRSTPEVLDLRVRFRDAAAGLDASPLLLKFATDLGLRLASVAPHQTTLEEVFRDLTSRSEPANSVTPEPVKAGVGAESNESDGEVAR
ncbi:MAG: ATP-binding cassette domain-containing protein [Planctomycetes bacterium]|nr:ATP-binding cassette domain-containing protein [Planctomycetota bacterium]